MKHLKKLPTIRADRKFGKLANRAHGAVQVALRRGLLVKQPCEVCGATSNVGGHHEDYAKPLDVIWLCQKHHNMLHAERKRQLQIENQLDVQNQRSTAMITKIDPATTLAFRQTDVTIFVRHKRECTNKTESKKAKCLCPKWLYIARDRRRISAKTRSWAEAERRAQSLRDSFDPVKRELAQLKAQKHTEQQLLEDALNLWIADKDKSGAALETIDKCRTLRKQLLGFAAPRSILYLHQVTTPLLTEWKSQWPDKKALSMSKKRGMTIAFFGFCVHQGWLEKNPAKGLSEAIGLESPPTLPFTREQYDAIIDATYIYDQSLQTVNRATASALGVRLRTLIQLMRWSGLAIRDAATLKRNRLSSDDVLTLRRAKTGTDVTVPIPHQVAEDLRNVPAGPKPNPEYFFWSGESRPRAFCGNWNRAFNRLWKLVNPRLDLRDKDGNQLNPHPHQFRDTFAAEFLKARQGDIRDLATLLGNTMKVCERHYLAFVPANAHDLNQRVRDSWAAQGAPKHVPAKVTSIDALRSGT